MGAGVTAFGIYMPVSMQTVIFKECELYVSINKFFRKISEPERG
jgi:hypothetical protein